MRTLSPQGRALAAQLARVARILTAEMARGFIGGGALLALALLAHAALGA